MGMTSAQTTRGQEWSLMGQAEPPPSVLFGEAEMELWPYRRHCGATAAVCAGLGRSGKAAVAAGAGVLPLTGFVVHHEEL